MRPVIAQYERDLAAFNAVVVHRGSWTDQQRTRLEQQRLRPLEEEGRRLRAALYALERSLEEARRMLDR